jgi:transaldolase
MNKETNIKKLYEFGQSVWLDNISRRILDSGKLKQLIDLGVTGVTSNPTIFDKAISESPDYDDKIREFKDEGLNTFAIYDELTIRDIQAAADLFLPVFRQTNGLDGYVSLEVNPLFANKVEETIKEAKRLYKKVNRANVIFKIPATDEGLEAGFRLLSEGININFTLIFSLEQYKKTASTFISAAKEFLKRKGNLKDIFSVASVFVSRIDSNVDKIIEEKIPNLAKEEKVTAQRLKGKAATANSSLIFVKYLEIFSRKEFLNLEKNGLKKQRVLWASTSTKNSSYSDIKYVTELIGKDTINTMPQVTIDAFLDHGLIKNTLTGDTRDSQSVFNSLMNIGIDVNVVCGDLLEDGVIAFEKSFNSLLKNIELKGEMVRT